MTEFIPSSQNVKILGRTIAVDEGILLHSSDSGVEFEYIGTKLIVTFHGDSSVSLNDSFVNWRNLSRVQIMVDGHVMLNTEIKHETERFVVFGDEPGLAKARHVVRILKLSEAMMSGVVLGSICIESDSEPVPTPPKDKLIEFVGDSITCGYSIDTDDEFWSFSTACENASEAYAYVAAQALDTDFSMVSYSGHGIISGYTPDSEVKAEDGLLPPYYELIAKSVFDYKGLNPENYRWSFDREPDVIVINLGTNDSSYTADVPAKISEYEDEYLRFLTVVRKNNPNAHIICALGMMGDSLYPAVERVVGKYSETYDTNISAFHMTPMNNEVDGIGGDYHPSRASHKKAAAELTEELRKWL